ncbi:hypothetical protein CERSUDRAFT_80310 [Gelatoporia subvermispora B]|uniref:Uncharacterized protein n=1 Tax=Ceriporiopsis subvermispora (strain B) TaxID=914234 RepID=M2R8A1_CERS8|nr:hypothetical protein CERSUDRAFT_80310 [Gelatoporia subvermispora B]
MTPTTPSSNRPSTRRRRSQNNGKAVPPVAPSKPAPTLAPSFLTHRAEKPTNREPPPHIHVSDVAPAHDVAHDVDALVEHVRSIAMDRPHTPGSYIDWAGDDDDSLPDLDDWGVTSTLTDRTSESSKATTSTKDTMISPILEDTLKPLPSLELSTAATSPASSTKGADESLASVPEASEKTPKVAQAEEPVKPSSDTPAEKEKEKAPRNRRASRTKNGRRDSKSETIDKVVNGTKSQSEAPVAEPVKLRSAEGPSDASPTKPTTHVPTHSSLPPKPVVAAAPRRNSRAGKVDAQSKPSVKESPVESKVPIVVSPPSATKVAVPEERQVTSPPTAPSEGVDRPFSPARSPEADKRSVKSPQSEPGLEASIWAPSSTKSPTPDARQAMSPLGLEASIHAPSSTRSSTPGHTSSHSVPDTRGFLSPNTRSRTQGRRPLHVNGAGDHLDAHSSHAHHSRTHSMPPTGPGTATAHARAVHATRPVITGDAISRLARTLGGAGLGIAKREVAAVSAAKN